MQLNDATRRGLRTAIDLLLSGGLTAIIVLALKAFDVKVTAEQVTGIVVTLTPLLSVLKNALEDRAGSSFLVSKVRPEPDPTEPDHSTVQPTETEVFGDQGEITEAHGEQVLSAPVPPGRVLVALPSSEVLPHHLVVGFTKQRL